MKSLGRSARRDDAAPRSVIASSAPSVLAITPSVLAVSGTLNNQNRGCNIVLKIAFLNGNFSFLCLGLLGFKEFLFHYVRTIIPMFARALPCCSNSTI